MHVVAVLALSLCAAAAPLRSTYTANYPARPDDGVEYRLLELLDHDVAKWVPAASIDKLSATNIGFMDVTEYYRAPARRVARAQALPSVPSQQALVLPLLPLLSQAYTNQTLDHLQAYNNRYYTSATGAESSLWIRDEMLRIAALNGRADVTVESYAHPAWGQTSVIATIPGIAFPEEIIVIGAHIDSTAPGMPNGRAPGCDDDASGFVAALDAYRVLLEAGFFPQRTIQFMGYAAEEVGLRGSQEIAQQYAAQGRNVIAVWQSEMNGYVGNFRLVMVANENDSDVDRDLSLFAKALVDEYADIGWYSESVNGQSDHFSWTRSGYRSACVAEAGPGPNVNPFIHSVGDTLDKLDLSYIIEFNKVTLAFAIEMSEF